MKLLLSAVLALVLGACATVPRQSGPAVDIQRFLIAIRDSDSAAFETYVDREALKKLYGPDLAISTMRATLERGKPHEQAVAIATLGLDPDASARAASIALIAPQLAHPYPLVRWFAQRALEQLTGEKLAMDLNAPAATLQAQAAAWAAAHR